MVKSCPNDRQVYSVSLISRSETNLDASVEESGPVRADEFDPERVAEFGLTDAPEDVVHQAEELKHVLAPILPPKAEVDSHNVSHSPFRSWCVRGRGRSLGHRKVDTKTEEAEQIPTVSRVLWATGRPST